MPILPNLPEAAGVQRTVRLFPAAPGAQGGELPLLQRRVHLAQAPLDARPQGVARAPPPEAHGGLGSPAAREHERKHFTHLVNAGSHAMNPCAADFAGTRRPVERAGLVAAETDFLHPYGHLRRETSYSIKEDAVVTGRLRGGIGYARHGDKAYREPAHAAGYHGEQLAGESNAAQGKPARWYQDPMGPKPKIAWLNGGATASGRPLWQAALGGGGTKGSGSAR